jgi:hypothetical protein
MTLVTRLDFIYLWTFHLGVPKRDFGEVILKSLSAENCELNHPICLRRVKSIQLGKLVI